jgi:hypothetical protein
MSPAVLLLVPPLGGAPPAAADAWAGPLADALT